MGSVERCHFPTTAWLYSGAFAFIKSKIEVSLVESTSPTVITLVRSPYFPVKIVALVGVQTGLDHTLSNRTPEFMSDSKLGMFGLLAPIEYPGVASSPMSSAMINKILGVFVFAIGSEGSSVVELLELLPESSLLQPLKIKTAKSQNSW